MKSRVSSLARMPSTRLCSVSNAHTTLLLFHLQHKSRIAQLALLQWVSVENEGFPFLDATLSRLSRAAAFAQRQNFSYTTLIKWWSVWYIRGNGFWSLGQNNNRRRPLCQKLSIPHSNNNGELDSKTGLFCVSVWRMIINTYRWYQTMADKVKHITNITVSPAIVVDYWGILRQSTWYGHMNSAAVWKLWTKFKFQPNVNFDTRTVFWTCSKFRRNTCQW